MWFFLAHFALIWQCLLSNCLWFVHPCCFSLDIALNIDHFKLTTSGSSQWLFAFTLRLAQSVFPGIIQSYPQTSLSCRMPPSVVVLMKVCAQIEIFQYSFSHTQYKAGSWGFISQRNSCFAWKEIRRGCMRGI